MSRIRTPSSPVQETGPLAQNTPAGGAGTQPPRRSSLFKGYVFNYGDVGTTDIEDNEAEEADETEESAAESEAMRSARKRRLLSQLGRRPGFRGQRLENAEDSESAGEEGVLKTARMHHANQGGQQHSDQQHSDQQHSDQQQGGQGSKGGSNPSPDRVRTAGAATPGASVPALPAMNDGVQASAGNLPPATPARLAGPLETLALGDAASDAALCEAWFGALSQIRDALASDRRASLDTPALALQIDLQHMLQQRGAMDGLGIAGLRVYHAAHAKPAAQATPVAHDETNGAAGKAGMSLPEKARDFNLLVGLLCLNASRPASNAHRAHAILRLGMLHELAAPRTSTAQTTTGQAVSARREAL